MLIDTHCHLDATEFDQDRACVWQAAQQAGVRALVIPAVTQATFAPIQAWCAQHRSAAFALGWHPMYVQHAPEDALTQLELAIRQVLDGPQAPQLVAVGEIGLDFFISTTHRERQIALFEGQLKLARQFELPVIMHVRGAVDQVLKALRRFRVRSGIAHAYNGSQQQAEQLLALDCKLGFGGAVTWPRANKLRHLASTLPAESLVLETDAPDIPPVWLGHRGRNSPAQLPAIAAEIAALRGLEVSQLIEITGQNVQQVLPKVAHLCT